jgi:AraC-like DNA-binding protein
MQFFYRILLIQYIKKVRLNKARELFLEKQLRVGEVAVAVGYESASQFSREFKQYFGNSPAKLNSFRN